MIKYLKTWEHDLLKATQDYIWRALPALSDEQREDVVVRIYAKMHRTLKFYHESDRLSQGRRSPRKDNL